VGTRPLPDDFDGTPAGLAAIVDDLTEGKIALTTATAPYDAIRLSGNVTTGPTTRWGNVAFSYAVDPRTKFPFPRIVAAGGANIAAANHYLETQHWLLNAQALSCAAQAYKGLGWTPVSDTASQDLGGWPDEQIEVTYLSPRLMSWEESGSIFCGGPHPDNHDDPYTLDLTTGKPLDLSLLFKGWTPTPTDDGQPTDLASAQANPDRYYWQPDDALTDFVLEHVPMDDGNNADCATRDSIHESLAISFAKGDMVRFGLTAMPSVAAACNGKLVDLPIADVKSLLTPDAAKYFPTLKAK